MHEGADREQQQPRPSHYEPFCGSGTAIIAAEMTGRCCHVTELDPAYVDVAIKRLREFSGENAMQAAGYLSKPATEQGAASEPAQDLDHRPREGATGGLGGCADHMQP